MSTDIPWIRSEDMIRCPHCDNLFEDPDDYIYYYEQFVNIKCVSCNKFFESMKMVPIRIFMTRAL